MSGFGSVSSENLGPVTSQTMLDDSIHFSRNGGGDHTAPSKPSTARFSMDGPDLRRGLYGSQNPSWNPHLGRMSPSSDGSDGEDEEMDDDDDDGLVSLDVNHHMKNNNSSGSVQSTSEKAHGLSKEASLVAQQQQQQHERVGNYQQHAMTVVEPDLYCTQMLHGEDGSASSAQKEIGGENGYGFFGRKEVGLLVDPEESLRTHLADPITGVLMHDAMVLPCGHSFGSAGMQHVFRVKSCCRCSRPISEDSVRPNLALRSAVQAFQREEESHSVRVSRRRERSEQEKCSYDDPYSMDSRGKGVQFPFVVSDRVIIKGNKRTPPRFVGRVAIVTTQCLNGWYVVKTLDDAESVKLQYRSLAKVPEDSSSNMNQAKSTTPNWL
ncbi:U-box domain-containing protein 62-like [Iris pallida]|uniref:U-box domain-containing protein 62-like n=1 Tax=Iris pallida TaxID=29817 RepID=A0AAX6GG41_IRIPA|nr:U-box domain-containing protein 62-like [Iris pallida]